MHTTDDGLAEVGLTLHDALVRIGALEAAAEKAARQQEAITTLTEKLMSCADLLRDEIRLDGAKRCQFVENSIERLAKATTELRLALMKAKIA